MRRVTAAALATLSLSVGTPADASGGRVTVSYLAHAVPVGTGFVTEAVCEATAHSGTSGDVAVITNVKCGVNGFFEEQTIPGSKAVAHITSASGAPVNVCYSATTTFVEQDGTVYDSIVPETCFRLYPREQAP